MSKYGSQIAPQHQIQYKYNLNDKKSLEIQSMLWSHVTSHAGHQDQILFQPNDVVTNWHQLNKEQRSEVIFDFADPTKVESS